MTSRGAAVTRAAPERPTEQCIALIDYDAINPDEISFRAGDVLNVTGKGTASGFWEGYVAVSTLPAMATVEGTSDSEREDATASPHLPRLVRGLFPNCLVTSNMRFKTTYTNYVFQNVALCLYTYNAQGGVEMSLEPGDIITAVRPSASPGWWYGVKSRGPAWTAPTSKSPPQQPSPSRFTDPSSTRNDDTISSKTGDAEPPELLFPTNFVTCDVVLVTFNFTGRQSHELSCRNGDVVQVHRRWNDGWWEGSLHNERGIFPSNYTVPNLSSSAPPLFCAKCRTVFSSNTFQSSCVTCAAETRVEDVMLASLEAYVRGETKEYDLFAYVDAGPLIQPTPALTEEQTSAPSREAVASNAESVHVKADDVASLSLGGGSSSGGTAAEKPARVPLLTDKDVADLASNRVKLME